MRKAIAALAIVTLAACGGGGGGNDVAKSPPVKSPDPIAETPAAQTPDIPVIRKAVISDPRFGSIYQSADDRVTVELSGFDPTFTMWVGYTPGPGPAGETREEAQIRHAANERMYWRMNSILNEYMSNDISWEEVERRLAAEESGEYLVSRANQEKQLLDRIKSNDISWGRPYYYNENFTFNYEGQPVTLSVGRELNLCNADGHNMPTCFASYRSEDDKYLLYVSKLWIHSNVVGIEGLNNDPHHVTSGFWRNSDNNDIGAFWVGRPVESKPLTDLSITGTWTNNGYSIRGYGFNSERYEFNPNRRIEDGRFTEEGTLHIADTNMSLSIDISTSRITGTLGGHGEGGLGEGMQIHLQNGSLPTNQEDFRVTMSAEFVDGMNTFKGQIDSGAVGKWGGVLSDYYLTAGENGQDIIEPFENHHGTLEEDQAVAFGTLGLADIENIDEKFRSLGIIFPWYLPMDLVPTLGQDQ